MHGGIGERPVRGREEQRRDGDDGRQQPDDNSKRRRRRVDNRRNRHQRHQIDKHNTAVRKAGQLLGARLRRLLQGHIVMGATRQMEPGQRARPLGGEGRRRVLLHVHHRCQLRQRTPRARALHVPPLEKPRRLGVHGHHHALAAVVGGAKTERDTRRHGPGQEHGRLRRRHSVWLLGALCAQSEKRALPHVLCHHMPGHHRRRRHMDRTGLHRTDGDGHAGRREQLGGQGICGDQRIGQGPELPRQGRQLGTMLLQVERHRPLVHHHPRRGSLADIRLMALGICRPAD